MWTRLRPVICPFSALERSREGEIGFEVLSIEERVSTGLQVRIKDLPGRELVDSFESLFPLHTDLTRPFSSYLYSNF